MDPAQEAAIARFTEAWRSGSPEPIMGVVDPEIVVDWSNSIGPMRGVYEGFDAMRKLFNSFAEAFADIRWEVSGALPFGPDRVVLTTRVDVRGRDSGVATTGRGAQVWDFAGQKVTRVKLFQSTDDALAWVRRDRLARARLYFVCDGLPDGTDPTPLLDGALDGGADVVQLREKAPRRAQELASLAEPFRRVAARHGALFILNDAPELVGDCGADGVHVGQGDAPVAEARQHAGPGAIVGLSTHLSEQLDAANAAEGSARPDYVSVGPVWETPTKPGRPGTGLEYVRYAAANCALPWFAIGGIDSSNVDEVLAAGAERVVVVRAIRDAADPTAAARSLREALPTASSGDLSALSATNSPLDGEVVR
jgi:thiamine-phosphate pyrophosphorylase